MPIEKFVNPTSRVVAVGLDADEARTAGGVVPTMLYGSTAHALSGPVPECDVLLTTPRELSADLLAAFESRLSTGGVVVVECDIAPGQRILRNPVVREVIREFGMNGYSILSPRGWLVDSEEPRLSVVARRDGYRIRDYAPGDEAMILDLFEVSFGQRRAEEHWRWEYERNPRGSHAISLAFDPAGRLAAQYAGYPVALWSADPTLDNLRANQIGDTMTARDVRAVGRGHTSLIVRTAKHFFASHGEGRVAFNYGFNTANIKKISSLFNESEAVEPVPYRFLAVDALPRPGLRPRLRGFLRRWTTKAEEGITAEWDAFFNEVAPAYGFLVRRDCAHLRWRYFDSPVWKYQMVSLRAGGKLVGWSVFRRVGDVLVWGDALFAPEHSQAAGLVLQHALTLPVGAGAVSVQAWFPERPGFWAETLDDLGLTLSKEPNDLWFMCTSFGRSEAATRLRAGFYYAACDSDLY